MYVPTYKINTLEGRKYPVTCYGCYCAIYMFYTVRDFELKHNIKLCGTCLDKLSEVPDHIPKEQALRYFRLNKRKERNEEEV